MEEISQSVSIKISTLAELIIRGAERVRFNGDEPEFKEIRDSLISEEKRAIQHPIYHLQFCRDIEYVSTLDDKTHRGVWYLWRKADWELAEEKRIKDKLASDGRVSDFNNNVEMFNELCIGMSKAMGCDATDDLVMTLATVITKSKNKTMCEFYGVTQATMDKVWNV